MPAVSCTRPPSASGPTEPWAIQPFCRPAGSSQTQSNQADGSAGRVSSPDDTGTANRAGSAAVTGLVSPPARSEVQVMLMNCCETAAIGLNAAISASHCAGERCAAQRGGLITACQPDGPGA